MALAVSLGPRLPTVIRYVAVLRVRLSSVLSTVSSTEGSTVAGSVAVLLLGSVSSASEVTDATFTTLGKAEACTVTTSLIVLRSPTCRPSASTQVTVPFAAEHSQPSPVAPTKVSPSGSVSVTRTGPGSAVGPWLTTFSRYVAWWPTRTGSRWDLLIARSTSGGTVTWSVDELSDRSLSVRGAVDGGRVVHARVGARLDGDDAGRSEARPSRWRARPARSQVTTPVASVQVQPSPSAETKVSPAGTVVADLDLARVGRPVVGHREGEGQRVADARGLVVGLHDRQVRDWCRCRRRRCRCCCPGPGRSSGCRRWPSWSGCRGRVPRRSGP